MEKSPLEYHLVSDCQLKIESPSLDFSSISWNEGNKSHGTLVPLPFCKQILLSVAVAEHKMLATYIVLFILASLILGETLVFLGIWFHISFQESIIVALSHLHKGKGPLIVTRIRILMFCVLLYWVYSTSVIFYSRWIFHGPINWRDDVALYLLILQASLLGNALISCFFFALQYTESTILV